MANKKFDNAKDQQIHDALTNAFNTMKERKYDAINQLVGYILSDDGTYISFQNNARQGLQELDRDDILKHILRYYFEV